MSTTTEVIAQNLGFSVFIISAIGICNFILLASFFLGGKSHARDKHIPYESGIDSVGSVQMRLSAKFYLVAMFFVIFDVESLYLYTWSISIRENGWLGFIESSIFIFILLTELLYLVRIGALNWTPPILKSR